MASKGEYLISPKPDVFVYNLDPTVHKYIVVASDGLLDVLNPQQCVQLVHDVSEEDDVLGDDVNRIKAFEATQKLIEAALSEWEKHKLPADNISAVAILLTTKKLNYEHFGNL